MDLKDIDVGSEPLHTRVDGIKNVFAAESDTVDHDAVIDRTLHERQLSTVVADAKVTFGEDCHILAWDLERLQRFADDAFTVTMGVEISLT